ncbi:MAG: hypothetical protein SOW31_11515 [Treponema sp.]|nr:hypothetical protein [Treponema sp.]
MDSNNVVIKYLGTLGYNPSTSYYGYIELWKEWYENYVPKFHEYHDQNGDKRELYKLGMAKRLCEDWSSILYTERDSIVCKNKQNQAFINKWLEKLEFNDKIPDNIETAFWSGTCGTIIRIKNAKIVNKKIVADKNTTLNLVSVNASQIIPLKIIDGVITDVAFVSKSVINGKNAFYIEIHELKKGGYYIQNKYIDEQGNEIENTGVIKEYETGSTIPLFNLLMPRVVNNIKENNGLGISIYANAIDQLQGVDIVYNNFMKDFYLGGKKVFYNKKLTKYYTQTYTDKETGEVVVQEIPIYPDDITKQQFQIVGDEADVNVETLVHEYNPDLRETENENGLNLALNILAFKSGLGKAYYKFEQGGVVTATQAILDNKDLVGNAKKHRSALNKYTIGIVRSILMLGRLFFNENVDENDTINLVDKDGFLNSEEDQKEEYMTEIAAGLRQPWEYRVKFFGEDEETAKNMVSDEKDRYKTEEFGE